MNTLEICPKCYSIHYDETIITSTKVIAKLILPPTFIYVKVVNLTCKKCKDETM